MSKVKVRFNIDTLLADGYHIKGSEAEFDKDYAQSIARLRGVEIVETPKKKRKKKED